MLSRMRCSFIAALACSVFLPGAAAAQTLSAEEFANQFKRALDLRKQGRNVEGAALYEKILPSAEGLYGTDGVNTAAILFNLANAYRDLGQYTKADPLYLRCLQIRETNLGKEESAKRGIRTNARYASGQGSPT
jgi:tetratricopeptide (TPR) repeat protein